jgi:lipopolysaccharide biosynthesis protein
MFWCRMDYLSPLLESSLAPADFNSESGQIDGTTAHAIERILGRSLHEITRRKMYVVKEAVVDELPEGPYEAQYKHV